MATIVPLRGHQVTLQIGDGATPTEVFSSWCGNTALAHNYNINTETEDLPDCTDPLAVNFESPFKTSIGESIEFSGILNPAFEKQMRELVYEEDPVNIRIVFAGGTNNGHLQGPAILTAAGNDWANMRAAGTYTGTLTFTAKPVWTPAVP